MSHIFISYSKKNSDYAYQLTDKLCNEGFDVWIDRRRLHPSQNWWHEIVRGLRTCAAFVVILTPEADASDWVQREIFLAHKWGKPLFPLLLSGDIESDNWSFFVTIQYEDVRAGHLPLPTFYDTLAASTPRKNVRGTDVSQKPIPLVFDSEMRAEIANPPRLDSQPRPWLILGLGAIIMFVVIGVLLFPYVWPLLSTVEDETRIPPTFTLNLKATATVSITETQSPVIVVANPSQTPTSTLPSASVVTPLGGSGELAFQSNRDGNFEIYVMNTDGGNVINLTHSPQSDTLAAWSADGERIAFVSDRDGNDEIYVMNADGSTQTNLSNHREADTVPVWSPDNSQIAFVSARRGNWEIFVMNADGSNQMNLTNNGAEDFSPAWSPDGTSILFHSNRDGNFEIYEMDINGGNVRRLTNNNWDDFIPSWSPDGSHIVFQSERNGNSEIYIMNASGGDIRQLTNNTADDINPDWSPDGTLIAYFSIRDGERSEIYTINIDGGKLRRLTDNMFSDSAPAWRPSLS